ncbi:MAG: type III PLP-dependent enzyme [Actinomycetota bacterium]|nr:type III PLP-dependent enzyme [Actinomycetota bacterium]
MIGRDDALMLAERFGTPLYAYDLDDVETRCAELRGVLPAGARLLYSLKANPLPAVAAAALGAGAGAEVSSEGELASALEAGFEPSSIVVTGPAKSDGLLERAVDCGVGCFSAESWRDLDRIAAAAAAAATTTRALLRLNGAGPPTARLAMTGVPSQFGFDEDDLALGLDRLEALANVDVVGIHTYCGTQLPDAEALTAAFRHGIELATSLAARIPIRVVNLGGGFPWPFATDAPPIDLAPLAAAIARLDTSSPGGGELWFESGRYVSASCGTLVSRVADVKRSRGTTYVVLDAGISHFGGMAGLGRVLRSSVSVLPAGPDRGGATMVADVVGPGCTPLDCLARGTELPELEPGDLVRVPNVGAYGATASLSSFLSHPAALEVSLRGGCVVDVARLRGGHERAGATAVGHDGA